MKILIIDDEPELLTQLRQILSERRYAVETVLDGEAALDRLFETLFDLIILDIMLPKIDGFSLLRQFREAGIQTPVLMLTAKSGVDDRVKGLNLGADDYLAKPFSVEELIARVGAILRRYGNLVDPVLHAGDLKLDTVSREVTHAGREIELTPKEFSILEFLLYNKNRVVSRFNLAERIWGDSFDTFSMSNFDEEMEPYWVKISDAVTQETIYESDPGRHVALPPLAPGARSIAFVDVPTEKSRSGHKTAFRVRTVEGDAGR